MSSNILDGVDLQSEETLLTTKDVVIVIRAGTVII